MIREMQAGDIGRVMEIWLKENTEAHRFIDAQSRGIGRQLMEHAKRLRGQLSLSVYQKNESAIRFYRREGFRIERTGVDEETGEPEFTMVWMRKAAQR